MSETAKKKPLVRHRDQTETITCPYGHVQRIVTGGDGGVGNVHVARVTRSTSHIHAAYDEIYYFLSGAGILTINNQPRAVRPGSVVVIPAGVPHEMTADGDEVLEFVIFGTPAMAMSDARAKPI
jgi:mannose-6-phosphate isomerase-like protein (cupin superfamily)